VESERYLLQHKQFNSVPGFYSNPCPGANPWGAALPAAWTHPVTVTKDERMKIVLFKLIAQPRLHTPRVAAMLLQYRYACCELCATTLVPVLETINLAILIRF